MNIFLDLEDTIIESWDNPIFLEEKISFIKKQIRTLLLDNIELSGDINFILFSMAVDNERSKKIFEERLKNKIEDIFKIEFKEIFVFSRKNINVLLNECLSVQFLDTDFLPDIFLRNEKEELFELICMSRFKGSFNVLFDDTVSTFKKEIFEKDLFSKKSTKIISIRV